MEDRLIKMRSKFLYAEALFLIGVLLILFHGIVFLHWDKNTSHVEIKDADIYTSTRYDDKICPAKEEPRAIQNDKVRVHGQWVDKEIERYIDLNNVDQLQKMLKIVKYTPLDMRTASIVVHYSEELNVSTSLLLALIEIESNFDQYEVGKAEDRGYCQIIPSTEKWLTTNYGHILGIQYHPDRIYEPEYNIGLGALYIHLLQKAYKEDEHRILSEYNRGPYNLKKYFHINGTYETTYSKMVLKNEKKYKALLALKD